jgi:dihydroneopterin aldolase
MRSITVLKIGGSLARSEGRGAVDAWAVCAQVRDLLIVPGGGDFADAVRAAQAAQGFSDAAAHRMALLAMHTMAIALSDLAAGFAVAENTAQFESAWRVGDTPVWAPASMVLAAADMPASWDVTSDSLAAWLAGEIDAARLVVVKSCALPADVRSVRALTQAGVVDACFARFVEGCKFSWQVVSGVEAALAALAE